MSEKKIPSFFMNLILGFVASILIFVFIFSVFCFWVINENRKAIEKVRIRNIPPAAYAKEALAGSDLFEEKVGLFLGDTVKATWDQLDEAARNVKEPLLVLLEKMEVPENRKSLERMCEDLDRILLRCRRYHDGEEDSAASVMEQIKPELDALRKRLHELYDDPETRLEQDRRP